MQLHEHLAHRIVERTQKIIKFPLNVMDETGIIIASSVSARKFQRHAGAVLALSELKPIEISERMLPDFPNVKPGINMPIIFDGIAIGVIGISGPLAEVRPLGQMVKMAAEMVVEYTSMLEKTRWSERKREEFLLEWIDRSADFEHITSMATQFKINVNRSHAICIIEVANFEDHKVLLKSLDFWSRKRLKAQYSNRQTIILLHAFKKEHSLDDWQSLQHHLKETLTIPYYSALGDIYPKPNDIPDAFESARAVLKSGKRLKPDLKFYQFNDYELPALLEGSLACWQRNKLMGHFSALEKTDPSLIKTIRCWFENNCDNKETSSILYIHPNTLRYRIKKVEEICQINLHNYTDVCRLYFSLMMH